MKKPFLEFWNRISTTNWFCFLLGVLTTLIIAVSCYAYIDEDVSLKDIVPSIATGVVSVAALLFSYLNSSKQQEIQERQQNVQIKTTIEKEWVEKIRIYLAEIIDYYIQLDSIINNVVSSNVNKPIQEQENYAKRVDYQDKLNQFVKNRILLSLYLNFNEPLEKSLNEVTNRLWIKALLNQDRIRAEDDFREIQRIAHVLFEERLKGND